MASTVAGVEEGSLVSGRVRFGGPSRPVCDPATGTPFATVRDATAADVADGIAAADHAQPEWAGTPAPERGAILHLVAGLMRDHLEEIAPLLTAEQGKPLAEARAEVAAAAEQFEWNAGEVKRLYGRIVPGRSADERLSVDRRPVGPVAALVPSNFPLLLAARKLAPALAAGCAVIWKPAPETPLSSLQVARLILQAGVPPGVLGVLTGDPAAISTALLDSPVIRKVSFTGSVAVGRDIARRAAEDIKHVSLELGGHAPVIVLADVDVPAAAAEVARSKFRNTGQVCIAPTRVYVDQAVHREFVEALTDRAQALRVGAGEDPATTMGPLTTRRRVAHVDHLVREAIDAGASRTVGDQPVADVDPDGCWYAPTVLVGVPSGASILRDEPFGPVVTVISYRDLDQAVAQANASRYGLAGYVFGANLERAQRVAERLDVGMVGINTTLISRPEMPFGGIKHSGLGREGGSEGIDGYLTARSVVARSLPHTCG